MSAYGTKQTSRQAQPMSAFGGKADIDQHHGIRWLCHTRTVWERGKCSGDAVTLSGAGSHRNAPALPYSRTAPAAGFAARRSQPYAVAPTNAGEIEGMRRPRPQHYQPSSSVLTLRTPIRSYAVIGRMDLGVPAGNEALPSHTRGLFLGTIECVRITNMWLEPLFASKERRRHAPKGKSKAG